MRSLCFFDHENHLVRVKHVGITDSRRCLMAARKLRSLEGFNPSANVLVDMRLAEDNQFRSSDWMSFGVFLEAEKKGLDRVIRFALLIATDDANAWAEARVYEGYVGSVSNMTVKIFDDAARAAEWLCPGKAEAVLSDDVAWVEIVLSD